MKEYSNMEELRYDILTTVRECTTAIVALREGKKGDYAETAYKAIVKSRELQRVYEKRGNDPLNASIIDFTISAASGQLSNLAPEYKDKLLSDALDDLLGVCQELDPEVYAECCKDR